MGRGSGPLHATRRDVIGAAAMSAVLAAVPGATAAAGRSAWRKIDLMIEVPSRGAKASIAATAHLPPPERMPARPIVMFALPGGGLARGYFDIEIPGRTGYSQAEHHTARGIVLIAVDHLGVGQSSLEAVKTMTIEDIADANDAAVRAILQRLKKGTLVDGIPKIEPRMVIGIGQSMGGGLTVIMQGRHRTYEAVSILGYSGIHTVVPVKDPAEREKFKASFQTFTRKTPPSELFVDRTKTKMTDARYPFYWDDTPHDVMDADRKEGDIIRDPTPPWGSATIPNCVVAMNSPGYVKEEASLIDCPMLIGLGERDVAPDPHKEPTAFSKSRDITLFICPRMGHTHNFNNTRVMLWDRIAGWADMLVAERA